MHISLSWLGGKTTDSVLEQKIYIFLKSYVKKIMFLGSKVWWVRKADNLTAVYEPNV
jgi:hypothetical protein